MKCVVGLRVGVSDVIKLEDRFEWSDGDGGVKDWFTYVTLRCRCGREFEKEESSLDRRLPNSCGECELPKPQEGQPMLSGVALGRPVGIRGRKIGSSVSLPMKLFVLAQEIANTRKISFSELVTEALEAKLLPQGQKGEWE